MIKIMKRYFCDVCKKEVKPNPLVAKGYEANPLLSIDFDLYEEEFEVCEECAKKIGEYIEGLRADMRGEEYASKGE